MKKGGSGVNEWVKNDAVMRRSQEFCLQECRIEHVSSGLLIVME